MEELLYPVHVDALRRSISHAFAAGHVSMSHDALGRSGDLPRIAGRKLARLDSVQWRTLRATVAVCLNDSSETQSVAYNDSTHTTPSQSTTEPPPPPRRE